MSNVVFFGELAVRGKIGCNIFLILKKKEFVLRDWKCLEMQNGIHRTKIISKKSIKGLIYISFIFNVIKI